MRPIGLHASDTHLRVRNGDEQHAFKQLVDAAVKHKVRYVCLAGDLLDKQSNRARVVAFLYKELGRLRDAGIAVLHTQGQHDFDDPPWFSAMSWTHHIHKDTRTFDGIALYGLDWQPFGKLQEELAEIPNEADTTLLVCHQVWGNWMGDVAAPQGSFEQIPEHVTHVHTGDLHQWKLEKRKNAGGETMTVLSTGATTQQKIDEPDTHHYALLYNDGRFEKRSLASRVMIDASLMVRSDDVDKFVAEAEGMLAEAYQRAAALELPEELHRPYLRVTFSSKLADVVRRVEKVVKDRAVLTFKQTVPEEKQTAYKAAKIAKGDAVTPLSVLGEEVDKEERPAAYELTSRLLSAPDKEMEFAKWRAEFLGEGQ